MSGTRIAFALAGLGGNNAHGAGFLTAAQEFQRQRDLTAGEPDSGSRALVDGADGVDGPGSNHRAERVGRAGRGILPELEFISCTSGAIHTTAAYLRGDDIGADLERRIAELEALIPLPANSWAQPWRAPAVALFTGVPHVFAPWTRAFAEHLWERMRGFWDPTSPFFGVVPSTVDDLCDLWLPARAFIPLLPEEFFEQTSATFNDQSHGVGVAFNSFEPKTGIEHLYVNEAGLRLVREHHDRAARYGGVHETTMYRPISPDAVRDALWLFYYGLPARRAGSAAHVDGAYARSIILDELTFADRIYAVKPINQRWIGRLPQNLLEIQDLQTELWMSTSYRQQARLISTVNRLQQANRLTKPSKRSDSAQRATKSYHVIDLVPVEIAMQRGFFTYFVEDRAVFEDAHDQSLRLLLNHDRQDLDKAAAEHTASNVASTGELARGRAVARPRSLAS